MRTLVSSIIAFSFILPTALAHAGGYLAVGIGSDASLGGELQTQFSSNDLTAGRVAAGYRVGSVAIEGVLMGTGLRDAGTMSQTPSEDGDVAALSAGVDLKYYMGISGGFEGYVKGGIQKTWVKPRTDESGLPMSDMNYVGRGYDLGAGLQYTFRMLPMVEAAVWLDWNRQYLDLDSETDASSLEGTADTMTLGISLGL